MILSRCWRTSLQDLPCLAGRSICNDHRSRSVLTDYPEKNESIDILATDLWLYTKYQVRGGRPS